MYIYIYIYVYIYIYICIYVCVCVHSFLLFIFVCLYYVCNPDPPLRLVLGSGPSGIPRVNPASPSGMDSSGSGPSGSRVNPKWEYSFTCVCARVPFLYEPSVNSVLYFIARFE